MKSTQKRLIFSILIFMISGMAMLIIACSEGQLYDTGTATSTLSADPPTLEADGASSTIITATVTDGAGNPVPVGTPVHFYTDLGRFSNGTQHLIVETITADGIVKASLISGTQTGTAEVRVESLGVTQTIRIPFVVPGTVTETASITLSTDEADTVGRREISATLVDKEGNPVAIGTSVTFQTSWGHFGNNDHTVTVPTTDSSGIVKVTLFAPDSTDPPPASVTVTARSGNITASLVIPIDVVETTPTPVP
jgi:hypothetical protein